MFISYSRHDGEFVRPLVRALEARGKDVWVDLDDIPKSADWHARVEHGIEASKAVVVVLSPSLAASQICGEEIRHAIEHNKRLIPILRTDVEPEQLYPELNAPNWILAREQDDGEAAFEELVAALETDLAWLEVHARLVARSVEWHRENRDGSFLLRGGDLNTARQWLAGRAEHREQPTELQIEYIGASRRSALIRRAMVGVAALGVVALAGFLLVQRDRTSDEQQRAERQEKLAESRRLAAGAIAQLDTNRRKGLATAVRAEAAAQTPEAVQALREALMQPGPEATLRVAGTAISSARFVDDDTVRARTADGRILRWSLEGGEPIVLRRGLRSNGLADSPASRAANLTVRPGFDETRVTTTAKGTLMVLDRGGGGIAGLAYTAVLSPSGRRVVTAGFRNAADVWRVPARVISPRGGARFVWAVEARGYVATCDDRGRVAIWPSDGSRMRRTDFDAPGFYDWGDITVAVSTDGNRVFVTSQREATLTVLDATTGDIVETYRSPDYVSPVISGDGRRLFVPREPRPVVEDVATGDVIATLPFRADRLIGSLYFDSTGERMAAHVGRGVQVFQVSPRRAIAALPPPREQLDAYALSASGRYVATAEADELRIHESNGGAELQSSPVRQRVNTIELSRDDAFVLTAANDMALVAERRTGRRVATFAGHRGALLSASFGPGARTVVTVGADGLAIVHDCPACAPPATLVKRARAALRAGG